MTNTNNIDSAALVRIATGFSRIEHHVRHERIMSQLRDDCYQAERAAARKFVEFYRELLSGTRLHRHAVSVWVDGCGYGLKINGVVFDMTHFRGHRTRSLMLLEQITATMNRNVMVMENGRLLAY